MTEMNCAQLRDAAPDMALGLLTGEDRAAAIAHLDRCQECRAEVSSLAETADELLVLTPEVEPPPNFESGVLARLPQPATPRRTTLTAWWAVAAAAVVAALVAAGAVLWSPAGPGRGDAGAETAEMRTGAGEPVGFAQLERDPSTVVVDVPRWADLIRRYDAARDADFQLVVERHDGSRDVVPIPTGSDTRWEIPIDVDTDEVAVVAVIDDQGRTWCSARFQ
jgi:hypothetical protein